MEGAVRSGYLAAEAVTAHFGGPQAIPAAGCCLITPACPRPVFLRIFKTSFEVVPLLINQRFAKLRSGGSAFDIFNHHVAFERPPGFRKSYETGEDEAGIPWNVFQNAGSK